MTNEKTYQVIEAGPVSGLFRKKDETIQLSAINAQTYLSQGIIKPVAVKKAIKKVTEKGGDK